jgi:hypothetical protein
VPLVPRSRYASGVIERTELIERAAAAYLALSELAETIEDEWQYVTDLAEAYEPAIRGLAGGGPLPAVAVAAVDEAIAEIGLITDPHKAIDWLSTFPHVVALALGGDVDSEAGAAGHPGTAGRAGAAPEPEPDDDSPFRMLRDNR